MGVDFKMGKVTPFLMFQGNAEKAINFYTVRLLSWLIFPLKLYERHFV